ncbi:SDR family oxidoreductase [Enterovirga rhinocerotis]|uniref:NAD(P)-dependent dehydrogenase (Short-subunit alcohol dehydrogenase family) n=1 Tax=Enterovirga rhinocerotis TaxID=1339210 RepID=A0A4R7C7W4_9HYPH|nr:SDR family oxidoreductase [Enterovirga rhinocerotis]TDR92926.1 NAD(P)-dependent dehydrogenase (short-subunit alcohol dehydrogenase family) [Enterovirga rhinocerotis]
MKRVLVTGATRGIGRAVSDRLAEAGWAVVGLARRDLAGFPGRILPCDLADEAGTAAVLDELTADGGFDALVNNAGINIPQALDEISLDAFRTVMEVDLRAPLQIVQALTPAMRERRFGRIVNIGSRAMLGLERHSSYAAAKAGLAAMARCWALELAGDGITVNTVAPGPVDTELFWDVMPRGSEATARYLASIPVKRMADADEIAATVAFFLSPEAAFITGQTLYACGGLTVGRALQA